MYNRNQYLFEAAVVDRDNMEFVTDKPGRKIPLEKAIELKSLERAGVYHITWQQLGKKHSYIGRAGGGKQTVRQRLQDHVVCIKRFGGNLKKYQVQIELMEPSAHKNFPARINQKLQKDLKTREKERIDKSKLKAKGNPTKFKSHNRESEFLFEAVGNSCKSTGLSDANCGAILALPLSGCCRSGFRNTCYSHTFVPAKSSPLNIRVNVDYLSPPAAWVSTKEDFSVQVFKCGSVFGSAWTTDIGNKRISYLGLPNSLSFSIAAATPGDKYFIKIYSRSGEELIADYHISQ